MASATRHPRGSARRLLLDVALERFAADGTLSVSLDEIRRQAGVSAGALYHHFSSKRDLAAALFVEVMAQFQEAFLECLLQQPDAHSGITEGVRFYLRWVSEHPAQTRLLLGERAGGRELDDRNRAFFAAVLAWWRPHAHYGVLRDLPVELIHPLWLGPAQEYARQWLTQLVEAPPAAVADVLAGAAWNALSIDRPDREEKAR